jgi:hypothetical protein
MSKKPIKDEKPAPQAEDPEEAKLDEAIEESFPASDPPSTSAPGHDTPVKGEGRKR